MIDVRRHIIISEFLQGFDIRYHDTEGFHTKISGRNAVDFHIMIGCACQLHRIGNFSDLRIG